MAIKDVSLQYAAMFSEAAEEEKNYEEACQKACKEAEEAKQTAIDEFDVEEINPSECGFDEGTTVFKEKPITEFKDPEELDKTGCYAKDPDSYLFDIKEDNDQVEESACQNEEDPVAHLMDPIGIKASTASLVGQDSVGMKVVESLLKKIDNLEHKLLYKDKKSVNEGRYYDLANVAGSIANILITHQEEWQGITDKNTLVEYLKKLFDDNNINTPYSRKLMFTVQQKRSSLEIIDYLFRGVILGGKGLQVDRNRRWHYESEKNDKQFKNLNNKFKINPDDDKADDLFISGDDYEEQQRISDEMMKESIMESKKRKAKKNKCCCDEADDSFDNTEEDDIDDDITEKPYEKSADLKKAEAIQELSFERKLTKSEEDKFREILGRLDDYEKDLLLSNLKTKTRFGRPGNHTGKFVYDGDQRIEIPPFNYTEDPEDHSQQKSIKKRALKAANHKAKEDQENMSISNLETNIENGTDLDVEDWKIAFSSIKNKDKRKIKDQLIDDIVAYYSGKTDPESLKAKENEILYVCNIFDHTPKSYDLGKAWGVSHVSASKFSNKIIKKLLSAFKYAGIKKISDIKNLDQTAINKIIKILKDMKSREHGGKIDKKVRPNQSSTNSDTQIEKTTQEN